MKQIKNKATPTSGPQPNKIPQPARLKRESWVDTCRLHDLSAQ